MSYQISYDSGSGKKKNIKIFQEKRKIIVRFLVAAAVCTAGVILLTKGKDQIWEHLLPGDARTTQEALAHMADGIKKGISLKEAILTFCRDIVSDAGIIR